MKGYIVVTAETLDKVAEVTGRPREFFEREMVLFKEYNHSLIIFEKEGQFVQVSIDNMYHIPFVMKQHYGMDPEL